MHTYSRLLASLVGRVGLRHVLNDVTVTGVGDGQAGDAEVLTACRAEVDVVARVVVHARLGQHRVVLDLALLQRRAVVGDDHQPGCGGEAVDSGRDMRVSTCNGRRGAQQRMMRREGGEGGRRSSRVEGMLLGEGDGGVVALSDLCPVAVF